MRISHKNRARLIAAAAGVSLFLNPGQAAADDDTGSGTGSGASSHSDSSGGTNTSGGNSASGDSQSTSSPGDSNPAGNSGTTGGAGGSDVTGGPDSTGGTDNTASDAGPSDDTDSGSGSSPDSTGTSGNTTPADTDTTPSDTTPADAVPSGNETAGTTRPPTETDHTEPPAPADTTVTPDTTNTWTEPTNTPTAPTTTGDTTPTTSTAESTSPDATGTADTDTTPPIGDAETPGDNSGPSEPDPTTLRPLGFTAPAFAEEPETTGEPETFSNAVFFAPPPATTPPAAPAPATPLTTLLTFFGIPPVGGPTAPTALTTPAPWTLLWWIQRTQSLLNNQTPTATSVLDPVTDGYTISLTTDDADGDPVATTVYHQPTHGTVVKNSDGAFTYTRDQNSSAADQFTIKVSDNGPHLHGLATVIGLFTGHDPHSTYVTVNIPEGTAAPANSAPVIDAIDYSPQGSDGVITGTTTATDHDGDTVTYTYTWDTTKGAIDYDTGTGAFTFTPTYTARHAAASDNATPGDKALTVTVNASDGTLSDTENFTLDILAANESVASNAPTSPLGTIDRDMNAATYGNTTGSLSGIATDADNDTLAYSVTTQGANGTVTIVGDSFTYTPDSANRAFTDTFTVTVDDGHGSTTDVTITVDTVPMYYHHIDPTNQFWDPSDAGFLTTIPAIVNPTGVVDYHVDETGNIIVNNTGSDPIMLWSITNDEVTALNAGGPATFEALVIASGSSATIPPRAGSTPFIWDQIILLQAPRGAEPILLGQIVLNDGTILSDDGIPQTPVEVTVTPGSNGAVNGVVNGHQAGTTYSVQGGTPTGGGYLTPDGGTVVFDNSSGTFVFTPEGEDQYWAGGGGPTTQAFVILADDGVNPPRAIAVTVPIDPIDLVVIDMTGLNSTDSPRYSYGVSDTSGTPILTVVDRTTAQSHAIALPSGHDNTSTVTFSADGGYAHITNSGGSTVSVIDLTTNQVIGTYIVTDNGDGTKSLAWTGGTPSGFVMASFVDNGPITGADFSIGAEGDQAIIVATQTDGTYTVYLADSRTGDRTALSTANPQNGTGTPTVTFIGSTGIALLADGTTVTSISVTDFAVLQQTVVGGDLAFDWVVNPNSQFAYGVTADPTSPVTSVTVVELTTGTITEIAVPPTSAYAIDANGSALYTYVLDPFTFSTQVTRTPFGDAGNAISVTVPGAVAGNVPELSWSSFDDAGNYYLTTVDVSVVAGVPTLGAVKVHVFDQAMNEIDTIVTDVPSGQVAAMTSVADGTVYLMVADPGSAQNTYTIHRVSADGSVDDLADGVGWVTADQQHMFVLRTNDGSGYNTFSVLDLTTDTQSAPISVSTSYDGEFRVFEGKYLAIAYHAGSNVYVHILDVDGNATDFVIGADDFEGLIYLDDQFSVITSGGGYTQATLIRA